MRIYGSLVNRLSYYTRARHYAETRRDYQQALKDSLEARSKVELEQKGGATVAKRGLSVEQQKERMYQRKSMHFKVFCQQYDIYNKMGENQLANTRIVPYHPKFRISEIDELIDSPKISTSRNFYMYGTK